MIYAIEPRKAQIMLDRCPDDEHIYEVYSRNEDGSFSFSYSMAPSAEEAEARAMSYPFTKSAVARLIEAL